MKSLFAKRMKQTSRTAQNQTVHPPSPSHSWAPNSRSPPKSTTQQTSMDKPPQIRTPPSSCHSSTSQTSLQSWAVTRLPLLIHMSDLIMMSAATWPSLTWRTTHKTLSSSRINSNHSRKFSMFHCWRIGITMVRLFDCRCVRKLVTAVCPISSCMSRIFWWMPRTLWRRLICIYCSPRIYRIFSSVGRRIVKILKR